MRNILKIISLLALVVTIVPSILFFSGYEGFNLEKVKSCMLISTLVWFVVTPFWMGRESAAQ